MTRVFRTIVLALALLIPTTGQGDVSFKTLKLDVTPSHAFAPYAVFEYDITLPYLGKELCSGWVYPIQQWYKDQWPYRKSCRKPIVRRFIETWGGPRYPLPFPGTYTAFIQYENITLTKTFVLLESGR